MRLLLAPATALAGLLSSCVVEPLSGAELPPGTSVVTFRGIVGRQAGGNRLTVQVEAERSDLSWVLLGGGVAGADGSWSARVRVASALWWRYPCAGARFRFRASNGSTVYAQDAACLGRSPTPRRRAACAVPVLDLTRGERHVGDLVITGQAQADAHACLTEVQGNLTLVGDAAQVAPGLYAPGQSFTLPRLTAVTGSLSIDGGRTESFSLPRLGSVGRDLSMLATRFTWSTPPSSGGYTGNAFSVPVLTEVGGSVTLTTARDGGGGATQDFDFDLSALTSVGNDVVIHNPVFPGHPRGLGALTAIPRDLVFDWGTTDLDVGDLLAGLTTVGRNAAFVLPPNSRTALAALQTVGGDVTVSPASTFEGLHHGFLPALHDVGGAVTLTAAEASCADGPIFPALTTVAGVLGLGAHAGFAAPVGATGAAHLSLGGIAVSASTATTLPFQPDVVVQGAGPVSFTGNPGLCPCQISAFAAVLAAGGWSGVLAESGNGASATCAPCPAATCP